MEQGKTMTWVKRAEYGAMGFIGSAFFMNGLTYFRPQEEYYVPRILLPLFELFGNTGLAIGLLLLGAGLGTYGFIRWRKSEGCVWGYAALVVVCLVAFGLFNRFSGGPAAGNLPGRDEQIEQIEQIRNSERPDLANTEADAFFEAFESLLASYREHVAAGNQAAAEQDRTAYYQLMQRMSGVIEPLSDEGKYQFSAYNAKLQIAWSEVAQ